MSKGVQEIVDRLRDQETDLLQKLRSCLQGTDAANAFVTFALFLLTRWWGERQEGKRFALQTSLIEFGAFLIYPHFGNTTKRDALSITSVITLVERIQEIRLERMVFERDKERIPGVDEAVAHVKWYVENVRSTQYIKQIQEQIESLQAPFENWFHQQIGIGPKRALEVLNAIQDELLRNFESSRKDSAEAFLSAKAELLAQIGPDQDYPQYLVETANCRAFVEATSKHAAKAFPVDRKQLSSLTVTRTEWDALINLIGFTKDARTTIADLRMVQTKPLFVLPDHRVLLVDLSCCIAEVFRAFEGVARRHSRFFNTKYQRNQKQQLETQAAAFLRRLFPPQSVFTGLEYQNPDKPGDLAELDAGVLWGPFLILVEVKGRQFRLREGLSDLGRLRSDLKANIQDSFHQAQRAKRYVQAGGTAVFKELSSGREMKLERDKVRRIYCLSITLHHMADLATQLANLKPLNLFSETEYPFSVSISDLDIITRFSEGPDVFLHYIQRRIELQRSEKNIHADELDLFGTYLDTRLSPPNLFWDRATPDGREFTGMWIQGGSERFDDWHDHQIGVLEHPPVIQLEAPPILKEFLAELRTLDEDAARWIAFSLLNLSNAGAQRFDANVRQLRAEPLQPQSIRSAIFQDTAFLAVITVGRMVDTKRLREAMGSRLIVEKYRRRLSVGLGFAIELNDPFRYFSSSLWLEGNWKRDPELEKASRQLMSYRLKPGQKKPKASDPCLCGSGNQFKHCCFHLFR